MVSCVRANDYAKSWVFDSIESFGVSLLKRSVK